MTAETLEQLHSTRPFKGYTMHLADGRSFHVDHPDALAYRRGMRMAILLRSDGVFEHIDLFLVSSITEGNGRSRRRKAG